MAVVGPVSPSAVDELLLERGDGLRQHPLVRRRAGRFEIGARPRQRELDGGALRLRLALLARQRRTERLLALGFGLLKLDVLALEPLGPPPQ
jgi:hypothetical protein